MTKRGNPKILYHDNGQVRYIEYKDEDGRHHRDGGPALLWFHKNGQPRTHIHCKHGERHNDKGYAYEEWSEDGSVLTQEFWLNGRLHRDGDPAALWFYKNGQPALRAHFKHGKLHNPRGYAYERWFEDGRVWYQEYWLNGKKVDSLPEEGKMTKRENPEITYHDNGKVYWIEYKDENGELHRDGDPAYLFFHRNGKLGLRSHCKHGQYHNDKGYAFEAWRDDGSVDVQEYWLNGKQVDSLPGEGKMTKRYELVTHQQEIAPSKAISHRWDLSDSGDQCIKLINVSGQRIRVTIERVIEED